MRLPAKDPRTWLRRTATALAATALALAFATVPPSPAPPAYAQATASAATKTITFSDGQTGEVTVSKTQGLRNEVVKVEWSGFRPSTGQPGTPWNPGTLVNNMQFPVVIFQCHHAAGEAPVREQCMTADRGTRPLLDAAEVAPAPEPAVATVPFTDVRGEQYSMVLGSGQLPDDWLTFGKPNAVTLTAPNGTGSHNFQIRTGDESPTSLGCGRSPSPGAPPTECSLVVIPVREMDCDPAAGRDLLLYCGVNPTRSRANDIALSESNWRHRVVFPLTFAPEEGHCELTDRERLRTMGSELAAEAMYSWIPALCGEAADLPVGFTPSGEALARSQYTAGAEQFVLGSQAVTGADRPTVHAPMAVSGFGFAFVLDDANERQVLDLNLNARLVAKLLTQSYRGEFCAAKAPYFCDHLPANPQNLLEDPEFLALNPHLDLKLTYGLDAYNSDAEPMATLVLPSGIGDVPDAVTSWIAADPQAAAFLAGEPDQWGTEVNPVFTDWALPVSGFEWRDGYAVPTTLPELQPYNAERRSCNDDTKNCPYLGEILADLMAQSSSSIREISGRVLVNSHPLQAASTNVVNGATILQRVPPHDIGMRNVIGLVDLATADRFALPLANLATGGTDAAGNPVFAAPTTQQMFRALQGGTLDQQTGVIEPDYSQLAKTGGYPGTMLLYGAGPTSGLDATTAGNYADLIEYAVGPGQVPGEEQGWLPPGYLPLPPELAQQALAVADAIRDQTGDEVVLPPIDDPGDLTPPPGLDPGDPIDSGGGTDPGGGNGTVPDGGTDPSADPTAPDPTANDELHPDLAATVAADAGWATWAIPAALLLGLVAFALATVSGAIGADPGSRVGRFLRWALRPVRRVLAPVAAFVLRRRQGA